MKAFSSPGVCLIAALATGCTFDASQLRALPDGAVESPAPPDTGAAGSGDDTASPSDAPAATGGSGGSSATGGSGGRGGISASDASAAAGGMGGSDGPIATGGARNTDGPVANGGLVARDAPVATAGKGGAGSGGMSAGGMGGIGGATSTGGAASTQDAGAGDASQNTASDVARDVARDVATDFPSGPCWSAGGPVAPGTVCRKAVGLCDVDEVCDGLSTACPFDAFKDKGEVCRPKAGDCDHEETCTGASAACPADTFLTKGAVCRSAMSLCDVAETCDGASAACPPDVVALATTQCRASSDSNICDPPEYCTGKSSQCPADAKYSPPAAAPTGVAVFPGTLLADVSWSAVNGATGYNVKSSTISTEGFTIRGSPTTSPFTVTPITAGQPYYFVVSAYSGQPSCESPNSSPPVSALSCVATPPTALVATLDTLGHVVLTWTPPSGSVASYSVSRSTTSGNGYAVLASGILTTSYTDSPVVPAGGTAIFYVSVQPRRGREETCVRA